MPCRIGITTDWVERRRDWEAKYPRTLDNWQILHTCYSKSEAQKYETQLAQRYGCEANPGGDGDELATWFVYYFEHGDD